MTIHTSLKGMVKKTMKALFGIVVILVSTPCASAYIEDSPMGRETSPFSLTDWSPKSFAPKIRIHPMGEPQTREDEINVDAAAHGIIRREYGAWTKRYGKVRNAQRFEIFKRNFVKQMEMNRKNGEFFLLNEYGDLTENEYLAHLRKVEKEKENEKLDVDGSKEKYTWENSGETLPAAPIKRVEDLTKEVLQSVMDASRKSVAGDGHKFKRAKHNMYTKMLAGSTIQGEKSLSTMVYTYLTDATLKAGAAQDLYQSAAQTNALYNSYIDFVYTPMQEQDEFDLLPTLLSAAITSSSQTIQSFLVPEEEDVHSEWETHAYAFSFDDGEEYYYE